MSAKIYLEGGGDTRLLKTACREGFAKLLQKAGFRDRMPQLVACGSRSDAFEGFRIAHASSGTGRFVAMLVDSEDPMIDVNATWAHVARRDGWQQPAGASDDQVLLMTICMETWIVADREALSSHYGASLQDSALPPLAELENRNRSAIQQSLTHATRNCSNCYVKGPRSYEVLGKLSPTALSPRLPSFSRVQRILDEKL